MLFNSQKWVKEKIDLYCQKSEECLRLGLQVVSGCIGNTEYEKWRETTLEVHRTESNADDLRREIEYFIFARSLFPESRGDILGLLERFDQIPNQIQTTVRMIVEQRINIPQILADELDSIASTTQKCVDALIKAVKLLFSDFQGVLEILGQIDAYESEIDKIQSKAIIKIFNSDLGDFQKILLRDLVNSISDVSNHAEEAGDFMRIIIAKRMM